MNSLQELRTFFEKHDKKVTDFTGYSMVCDGATWGIIHDDPVRDGKVIELKDWKVYVKTLKK